MFAFGRRLVRNRTTTTTTTRRTEIKSFVFPFYFSPLYPVYFFFSVSSTPFSFSASLKCSKGFSDAGEDLSCLYNILEINSRFPPFQIASVSVECEAKNKQIRRKTGDKKRALVWYASARCQRIRPISIHHRPFDSTTTEEHGIEKVETKLNKRATQCCM